VQPTRLAPPLEGSEKLVHGEEEETQLESPAFVVQATKSFPPAVALGQLLPSPHPIGPAASKAQYLTVEANVLVIDQI